MTNERERKKNENLLEQMNAKTASKTVLQEIPLYLHQKPGQKEKKTNP